jgi:hypothetical protein
VLDNDVTEDYAGEPHERALLHVLRALNFAFQAKADDAVVEARKVTAFLEGTGPRVGMKTYRDDAFAHLLSAMLFEDEGKLDDARISREAAARAYALYARDYGTPPPRFALASRGPTDGEIVLIHYAGRAPLRFGERWRSLPGGRLKKEDDLSDDELKTGTRIALPAMYQERTAVRTSNVAVAGRTAATVKVEPIAEIALQSLADQMEPIRARAIARASAKGAAFGAAEAGTRGIGAVVAKAGRSAANAAEESDARGWSTLPAEIRMARIVAPEGVHTVEVSYEDANGVVLGVDRLENVQVTRGYRTYLQVRTAK